MAQAKDLIIGAALGYDRVKLAPFLRSLRASGFHGRLALIVDESWGDERKEESDLDISLVRVRKSKLDVSQSPTVQRYFIFRELIDRASNFERVLISDTRDVIFQKDPFAFEGWGRYSLFFPLEEKVIGNCGSNTTWISRRYGNGVLNRLRGDVISCCGTVFGDSSGIKSYLAKMCGHLQGSPHIFGIDQGVHNYIVNIERIDGQCALVNGLGPVMTMHYMKHEAIKSTLDGFAQNYDGTLPNIVHQYDRLPTAVLERLPKLARFAAGEAALSMQPERPEC